MTKYNRVGKLVATYGLMGELVLKHELGKKSALKGLEFIFVEERKDEMLPYFIQSAKIKNDEEIYLKLEGLNAKEQARRLVQKEVWLTEGDFNKYASRSSAISLLGYHLFENNQDLGEILEIIEQPQQLLCRIDLEGKEALIPLHDETLQKIDKKNRRVHVILPEGLMDIYR